MIDSESHDLLEILPYKCPAAARALLARWVALSSEVGGNTKILLETDIEASPETCFDLARSIDFHVQSARATQESAIGGVTTGLIAKGQEVEWKARHFSRWWKMKVRITAFDPPNFFQDRMVKGPFRSFIHNHTFALKGSGTLMTDTVWFQSPVPVIGWLLDRFVLSEYLRTFLQVRSSELKAKAEAKR